MHRELGVITVSPSRKNPPSGLAMSPNEALSSGFTAVNGDRNTGFRVDDSQKAAVSQDQNHARITSPEQITSPRQYHNHGWRPETRPATDQRSVTSVRESTEGSKRKRESESADSRAERHSRPEQPYVISTHSPKRHGLNLDSAVDLTSPAQSALTTERLAQYESVHVSYSRERSPVTRWNAGEPPPRPRPEVEAGLEAALKATLQANQQAEQAQQALQAQQKSTPSDSSPAPEDSRQDYSPDPTPASGENESKKRKRNFSNRTKTGCHTCRHRKKKCDEGKPTCANCHRGNFECGGYGVKPTGWKPPASAPRAQPVALQSKPAYESSHGPTTYYHNAGDEGRTYSHWGRIPPDPEPSHPPPIQHVSRPSWPPSHEPPPSYISMPERLPPSDFSQAPPYHSYAHRPPMPPSLPPPPPPLPQMPDPWADHGLGVYRPPRGGGGMMSSRDSVTTSSSQRTAALALNHNPNPRAYFNERNNMHSGKPYLHFRDILLLKDRTQCKRALERWNDAWKPSSRVLDSERSALFKAIIEPTSRPDFYETERDGSYHGLSGHIGASTIVDSPFTCDYGYNLHFGDRVVIQAGCYMQDACKIEIGDRTIVGPNVRFYGMTASMDSSTRNGSHDKVIAGPIKVGEEVFIGGDVIIMPYRTIGRGAVIGAGSVVTRDVKEYTVVAGNPAKFVRRLEPGPNIELHHPDIEDQNNRMKERMRKEAQRSSDW